MLHWRALLKRRNIQKKIDRNPIYSLLNAPELWPHVTATSVLCRGYYMFNYCITNICHFQESAVFTFERSAGDQAKRGHNGSPPEIQPFAAHRIRSGIRVLWTCFFLLFQLPMTSCFEFGTLLTKDYMESSNSCLLGEGATLIVVIIRKRLEHEGLHYSIGHNAPLYIVLHCI